MTDQTRRIALFIDFDNGQLNIHYILEALRERGILLMKRAYGDWERFSRFKNKLAENGVELIERPPIYSADKNGADITLAVEAMEACLVNQHIDDFAIVSGDSDFLPLISRLQAHNKRVIVIAKRANASNAVIKNCNEYISYDNLVPKRTRKTKSSKPDTGKADAGDVAGDGEDLPWLESSLEGSFLLLSRAVQVLEDEGGEARSSVVKQKMVQMSPSFSERDYGFNQYRDFLQEAQNRGFIKLGKKVEGSFLVALGERTENAEENGTVKAAGEPRRRQEDPRPAANNGGNGGASAGPARGNGRPAPEPAAVIADPEGLANKVLELVSKQNSAEILGFGEFAWEERRDGSLRLRFRPTDELLSYLNNDLDGEALDAHLRYVRQMEKPDVAGLFSRLKGVLGGAASGPDGLINFLTTTARTLKGTGACRWEHVGTFRTAESTRQPARPDGSKPLYTRFYAEGVLDKREPQPAN